MSNYQRRLVRVAAAAVAVIGWGVALVIAVPAALAATIDFTFTKIADTSTPIPGGTGNFTRFDPRPSIDGGDVAFKGFGDPSFTQQGIYSTVGGPLGVVSDQNTAIPGGTGNFTAFGLAPSIDGGDVAFRGTGTGQQGIYSTVGGLNVVADFGTAIPGGTGNFTAFANVSIDGGDVAFLGGGAGPLEAGIYSTVGGLNAVADRSTAIPGGTGNFGNFGVFPSISGGDVAFFAVGPVGPGERGFYSTVGGLNVVANFGTAIPGGTGNFEGFGPVPSIDGGDVAFQGAGELVGPSFLQRGIYSTMGGLNAVADLGTAIPGGTGNFTAVGLAPSIDGGNVAFLGVGSSGQLGLYLSAGGMLQEIISLNDTLDGKTLLTLNIFNGGLSGTSIAFFAFFTDGSNGIYRADAVSPVPLAIDIDIKPGSFPNSINQGSGGVTPVAILGSDTFDATQVDGSTCTLADAAVKVVGKSDKLLCSVEDVSGDFSGGPEGAPDGFLDQVCKFVTTDLGVELGDTEATIQCSAPEAIEGTDSIRIVPPE